MTDAVEHEPRACDAALSKAFGFLGKRWNGMLVSVLLGGPAGYSELRRALGGITDSVLSDRLSELAAAGLVQRTVDAGPPVAVSYELTSAGAALAPALDQLSRWASENLDRCAGPGTASGGALDG